MRVITGDCMDVLKTLEAESIEACVTDPPYGLAFMGRDWDDFEPKEYQEWCEQWATECLRVFKPGGHLLAFSGNRTHHRLFTGVEDAGFEVRDTLTWHYGSGFPKASDISKTIDKRADAEREVVGTYTNPRTGESHEYAHDSDTKTCYAPDDRDGEVARERTAPATDAAKEWDGWKTGLKPATEFVVMARKPYDGATVDCVLEHGTGALNIDATRIGLSDDEDNPTGSGQAPKDGSFGEHDFGNGGEGFETPDEGRYPANVVFDEMAADALDEQVGETNSNIRKATNNNKMNPNDTNAMREMPTPDSQDWGFNDSGGPSRYFYTSKATKAERTLDGQIDNSHPTVKPVDLMEWLIKLVTKEGQTVIDPFTGSGTTGMACKELNREFIGIEQDESHAEVARARIGLDVADPSVLRSDTDQEGLEAFDHKD
jgi:site-specific DNA-methyltransferase (adenine-specific)